MLKSIQHFAYIAALMAALALLASCTGGKKRYVIGVSQCSEDVWREKLNQELRVAALYYNNMDLDIASANDDVRLQTDQINRFVDKGVDLLIVAPGQVSISPAIDRAYEKGIPVIIFDRRTRSNKYTAYIGADNREIGASMGEYLAGALPKGGRVVELCGLSSSSPAIERAEGFDSVVAVRPSIDIVAKLHADWTEQGGFRAMDSLLRSPHPDFDCLFAHNDRMAMGARRAAQEHGLDLQRIRFCGIDAMPQKGAGLELVKDGTLFASYIYPTRGDEVMRLAMNILEGKSYQRENRLSSALVTRDTPACYSCRTMRPCASRTTSPHSARVSTRQPMISIRSVATSWCSCSSSCCLSWPVVWPSGLMWPRRASTASSMLLWISSDR